MFPDRCRIITATYITRHLRSLSRLVPGIHDRGRASPSKRPLSIGKHCIMMGKAENSDLHQSAQLRKKVMKQQTCFMKNTRRAPRTPDERHGGLQQIFIVDRRVLYDDG